MSKTPVRKHLAGGVLGAKLPCCWDTCDRDGYEEHKTSVRDTTKGQNLIYIFCSEGHKGYWLNSQNDYGNAPPVGMPTSGTAFGRGLH